jgi:small-conductance mechanosensitive channel
MDFLRNHLNDPLVSHGAAILVIIAVALMVGAASTRAIRAHVPRLAMQPIELVTKYLLLIVAGLMILGRFFDLSGVWGAVTTILAMVGVGFIAVWSVLSNAMCTFVLIFSRPFRVGDKVELLGAERVEGRVVDLTLIYTTLRAEDGALVRIPNNLFFQRVLRCKEGEAHIELEDQLKRTELAG